LEKREWQKWVDGANSPLPKAVIHYWRRRIGVGGWLGVENATIGIF
jgi:hypothetical protein